MKAKSIVLIGFIIVSFIFISISIAFGIENLTKWSGIGVGICISILAAIVHVVGNELSVLHVVSYLMNSIAVGFSISSFYIYIEQIIEVSDYITVSVIGILATVVLFSATSHKASKAYKKGMIIVFIIASFILTLVLWFTHHQPIYSLLFFYMIILNFYIGFSLVEANHIKDWLKHNSLASFGYFMVVSTLILIVISEGQILEGLDGLGYIGSGKQKDQQRS